MGEKLNRGVGIYIGAVVVAAVLVGLAGSRFMSDAGEVSLVWFFVVVGCVVAADIYPIVSFGFGGTAAEVTVSLAMTFAVACIWPPLEGMALVALGSVISDLVGRVLSPERD